jgi:hypothetical protein
MTPPPAATAGGTRALPRTAVPRAPRRVSGPATRNRRDDSTRRARTRGAVAAANDPFIVRALNRAQRMSDSRFLDRLIRGRLWIPLVAVGLMGIVFMQVTMLKFNAGIGRAVTSAATLEQQNQAMRTDVSRLESGSRVDAVAHDLGMVVPADGTTAYVAVAHGQAHSAVRKMTPANATAVQRTQAGAQAPVQVATGTQQPVTPTTPTTPTTTTTSTTGTATAGAGTTTGTTGTTAQQPSTAVAQAPTGGTATTASTGTGSGTAAAATTSGGTAAAGTTAAAAGTAPATQQQQPQAATGAAVAPQG